MVTLDEQSVRLNTATSRYKYNSNRYTRSCMISDDLAGDMISGMIPD